VTVRARLRFSKVGMVRWTSHRDVARMWERAFRRVDLPLAYTQGFNPRPRVSFGLALPTGSESVAEYLDIELAPGTTTDIEGLPARLTPALPDGLAVMAAVAVEDRAPSLQDDVASCTWTVEVRGVGQPELGALLEQAMAAPSLMVTRNRKGRESRDDVRPAVRSLCLDGTGLRCTLATQPRGLRPSELLTALRPGLEEARVRRLHQWIERDGATREPIPLAATDAPPHALLRAS
jgi:radical SAM-linked protein